MKESQIDGQMDRKLRSACLDSLMERACSTLKTQQVCDRVEERQGYCRQLKRRWAFHIQMNKEVGLLIHSWIKETRLANLPRGSLCRGTIFRM